MPQPPIEQQLVVTLGNVLRSLKMHGLTATIVGIDDRDSRRSVTASSCKSEQEWVTLVQAILDMAQKAAQQQHDLKMQGAVRAATVAFETTYPRGANTFLTKRAVV